MNRIAAAVPATAVAGFRVGDLLVDVGRHRVTRGDTEIPLTGLSFELLLALARAAPNLLTYDQLMAQVWPRVVVNQETVIQRVKLVRTALGDDPHEPKYIGGIRGVGYRLIAPVAALTELSPPDRTHSLNAQESAPPPEPTQLARRRLPSRVGVLAILLSAGVLAVGSLFIALDSSVLNRGVPSETTGARSGDASIAVLPFVDLSPARDNEYFSDGVSEELLNRLAKMDRLRVTGRTSSFAFKGKNEDLRTIGEKLGVDHILEGSVRKQGEWIRINVQLVDARDGSHLWSEAYDRRLGDVFAIQEDIARNVTAAVMRTVLVQADSTGGIDAPVHAPPTSNLEAYTSYLRGKHLLRARIRKDMEQALVQFERAVTQDQYFAEAYVGIADSLLLLAAYGFRNVDKIAAPAEEAIARALELNPRLAEAYAAKHRLNSRFNAPRADQDELIHQALQLNPNDAYALHSLSAAMWVAGKPVEEIVAVNERAYLIDPLSPPVVMVLAQELYRAGQKDRGRALRDELATFAPHFAHRVASRFAGMEGRIDEVARWNARTIEEDPENHEAYIDLGRAYADLGDIGAAQRTFEKTVKLAPESVTPVVQLIRLHLQSGDPQAAQILVRYSARRHPDDLELLTARAFYEYHTGASRDALATLQRAYPQIFLDQPEFTRYDAVLLPDIAFLARQTGDLARARRTAAAYETFAATASHASQKGYPDWMRARMAAAVGDRAGVVKQLGKLYETGAVLPAWIQLEPLFKPYMHDPEIASRLAKHVERRAAWLRELRADGL